MDYLSQSHFGASRDTAESLSLHYCRKSQRHAKDGWWLPFSASKAEADVLEALLVFGHIEMHLRGRGETSKSYHKCKMIRQKNHKCKKKQSSESEAIAVSPRHPHRQKPCTIKNLSQRLQHIRPCFTLRSCQADERNARRACPSLHSVNREGIQTQSGRTSGSAQCAMKSFQD